MARGAAVVIGLPVLALLSPSLGMALDPASLTSGITTDASTHIQAFIHVASGADGKAKKRSGPAPVTPVSRDGVRYEAVHWGKARGLGQNGGYIVAIDESSGEELWILKVYEVTYDADKEADKQDVFITGLSLNDDPDHLVVEHERGGRYLVDLPTRTAKEM